MLGKEKEMADNKKLDNENIKDTNAGINEDTLENKIGNAADEYVHAPEKEGENEPKDPNLTIDIKNEAVTEMMNRYATEKSVENLNRLISVVHTSRMLVPANLNDKGQPVPCFIKNAEGGYYMPIYTNKEQIPNEPKSPVIMNMPYINVNEMALRPEVKAEGIVINPFTNNLIFKKQLLEKIAQVEEERKKAPKTKSIKLSEQQYVIFERLQFEHRFLPAKLYEMGEEFINTLLEKKSAYIDELFEESYQQTRMYPYLEEEFQVMPLSISEDITLVRVDMPTRDLGPGCCHRIYLSWNKSKEEAKYFFIEQVKGEECILGEVANINEKPIDHGPAPAEGAELPTIVDYINGNIK